MIRQLNLCAHDEVSPVLNMQRLAYGIEADLIGFHDIPALNDTIHSLQSSNETFYGYFDEAKLTGAISYTREGEEVDICRLVVHPDHFRRGIGKALLTTLLDIEQDASRFIVSTGTKNVPAVQLYHQYGFVETGHTEIADGVFVSHFAKINQ